MQIDKVVQNENNKNNETKKEYKEMLCRLKNLNFLQRYFITTKKPTTIVKKFLLVLYLLYVRYTIELGISLLTFYEAVVTNCLFFLTFVSLLNIGTKLICYLLLSIYNFIKVSFFFYRNYKLITILNWKNGVFIKLSGF